MICVQILTMAGTPIYNTFTWESPQSAVLMLISAAAHVHPHALAVYSDTAAAPWQAGLFCFRVCLST